MSIITQFTSFIFSWLMRNLGGLFIKRSLDETSPLNELYTEILNEVYWFDFTVIQCSTVQCSVVQYSVVQYSVVQYSVVQYSVVQYSVVQYSVVQYSVVQYSVVQCSVVQCSVHSTVQYITLQYNSTVQYSTVQCSAHSAVLVKLFLKLLLLNGLVLNSSFQYVVQILESGNSLEFFIGRLIIPDTKI